MGKIGELGIVTNEHHAPQIVLKLIHQRKQGPDIAAVEALVDDNPVRRVAQLMGDKPGRRQGPTGGARQDKVGHPYRVRQTSAHQGGVAQTALRERPRPVRQCLILPARLAVTHQDQRSLHDSSCNDRPSVRQ
ncbi:hypothetical protein D3C78_1076990 [compost metagenome]